MASSSCLRGGAAEQDEDIRIGKLDLALDEGPADLRLLRRRRAVAGRPPGNDVGDVGALPVEADRADHAVEQLPGAADEGQAGESSSRPGASPTNMTRPRGLPSAKTRLVAVKRRLQPSKASSVARSSVEGGGRRGRLARRHDRCLGGNGERRRGRGFPLGCGRSGGRRWRRTVLAWRCGRLADQLACRLDL